MASVAFARYSPEDEASYRARFERLRQSQGAVGTGLSVYDPIELVEGSKNAKSLPVQPTGAFSTETLARAEQFAAQRNSSILLIWRDGQLEHEKYFGKFAADTLQVSKSLSKPLTAILIGRALKQGYVQSLDQSVSDFITEWQGDPKRQSMKIRHLLDMRSGMLRQGFALEPESVLNRAYLHPRHDEVIIHDYPMTHSPGARYEYANATAELIAPVIERATGMRFAQYLSTALLEPLRSAGGGVWVNREGGMAHSGCCLLLPAQSWLKMGVLLMQDGVWDGARLLPEGYVDEMRRGTMQNPHYGLGIWIAATYMERRGFAHPSVPFGQVLHSEPYADKDVFLFDGNGNQVVYMIPSANMVIVRMGARPPEDLEWDNSVLPNLLIGDLVNRGEMKPPVAQSMAS